MPDVRIGSLLQQRDHAKKNLDHIRKAILQEPRGHPDMYGAILVPQTELSGGNTRVDLGALFLTNEGYSTMVGSFSPGTKSSSF